MEIRWRDSFLKMTGAIDKAIGGDVTGIKPFTAVDNAVHEIHLGIPAYRYETGNFGREFERMLADPKNAGKDVNQIAADAASYTNNIFGGLNWDRVIEGMKSKFGRGMAGSAYSKHGRAVLQTWPSPRTGLCQRCAHGFRPCGIGRECCRSQDAPAYLARSLMYTMRSPTR